MENHDGLAGGIVVYEKTSEKGGIIPLTLTVLVTTVDALRYFETGQLLHSGRGWGM